jgi:preprotein translocase SecE subunit
MTDPDQALRPPKKRRLRAAPETVRERGERAAATQDAILGRQPRLKNLRNRVSQFRIWRPLKFIGRYLVPPYFRSSWRELRQVTWPSRKQTRQLTGAVIVFSVVFGVIVAVFDYGLDRLFKQVIVK